MKIMLIGLLVFGSLSSFASLNLALDPGFDFPDQQAYVKTLRRAYSASTSINLNQLSELVDRETKQFTCRHVSTYSEENLWFEFYLGKKRDEFLYNGNDMSYEAYENFDELLRGKSRTTIRRGGWVNTTTYKTFYGQIFDRSSGDLTFKAGEEYKLSKIHSSNEAAQIDSYHEYIFFRRIEINTKETVIMGEISTKLEKKNQVIEGVPRSISDPSSFVSAYLICMF